MSTKIEMFPSFKGTEWSLGPVIGKKIKEVRYMTDKELDYEGWAAPCLVLVLEGGALLYPSKDSEGNGPGCLFMRNRKRKRSFVLA